MIRQHWRTSAIGRSQICCCSSKCWNQESRSIDDFLKTDIFDESRWPEYYEWLAERIIRMREVMVKRL
jgi:hypothetical protein